MYVLNVNLIVLLKIDSKFLLFLFDLFIIILILKTQNNTNENVKTYITFMDSSNNLILTSKTIIHNVMSACCNDDRNLNDCISKQ